MTSGRVPSDRGPGGPQSRDIGAIPTEAALEARLRASYARMPAPDAAQVARCTAAVLAEARLAPTRRFDGALRPRWWWGVAAAALLVVSITRPWQPEVAPPAGAPSAERAPVPVGTTTASGEGIRFDLTLPNVAAEVALVGDFNGWDAHATPMIRRRDDGAWSAKVPLPPGRHVYAFVVDGRRWLVDPLAPQVPDEGYGPANAVVVDGPR